MGRHSLLFFEEDSAHCDKMTHTRRQEESPMQGKQININHSKYDQLVTESPGWQQVKTKTRTWNSQLRSI